MYLHFHSVTTASCSVKTRVMSCASDWNMPFKKKRLLKNNQWSFELRNNENSCPFTVGSLPVFLILSKAAIREWTTGSINFQGALYFFKINAIFFLMHVHRCSDCTPFFFSSTAYPPLSCCLFLSEPFTFVLSVYTFIIMLLLISLLTTLF